MKYFLMLFLLCRTLTSSAQYNKEKIINILTDGNTKSWSVKGTNVDLPEKVYIFNKNGTMQMQKESGKGSPAATSQKWLITTKDNIRWFIQLGNKVHELIISYDKTGGQYIKLTYQAVDNTSVYYETILRPLK